MSAEHVIDEDLDGVRVISFRLNERHQALSDAVRQYFAGSFLDETAEAERLVIDLSGVATLDSASLGPLIQRLREVQERHGHMALCGVDAPALREVFALTRFDKIFAIYRSRAEAVQALAKR